MTEMPTQLIDRRHAESRLLDTSRRTSAIQDRAPFWVELRAMIVVVRVRLERDQTAGRVDRTRGGTFFSSLLDFAQINQQHAAVFDIGGSVIAGEVLDALRSFCGRISQR